MRMLPDEEQALTDWVRGQVMDEVRRDDRDGGYCELDLHRALLRDQHSFPGRIVRLFFADLSRTRRDDLIREAVDYWVSNHRMKIVNFEKQQLHEVWSSGRRFRRYLKHLDTLDAIIDATAPPVLLTLKVR